MSQRMDSQGRKRAKMAAALVVMTLGLAGTAAPALGDGQLPPMDQTTPDGGGATNNECSNPHGYVGDSYYESYERDTNGDGSMDTTVTSEYLCARDYSGQTPYWHLVHRNYTKHGERRRRGF